MSYAMRSLRIEKDSNIWKHLSRKHAMQNRTKLLCVSFLTLIAAGVGFMVRNGGVLGEWAADSAFALC